MQIMLDTVNLEEIKKWSNLIAISGVTSNPSIIKKEGKINFFEHMNAIKDMIGRDKSLHVQVVAQDYEGIIRDAETITKNISDDTYIKVPVNEAGIRAIKELKEKGFKVTATAVYTKFQAYLAIDAGADFIAPYYNRMQNLNIDPDEVISSIAYIIEKEKSESKILAASFKNVAQVNSALESGAQNVTVSGDILAEGLAMPTINLAVNNFTDDWESIFGKDVTIASLG